MRWLAPSLKSFTFFPLHLSIAWRWQGVYTQGLHISHSL